MPIYPQRERGVRKRLIKMLQNKLNTGRKNMARL